MHDIDRGANSTAARLAALAALRNAQADEARDADRTRERSAPDGRSRRAADTEDGSNDRPRDTAGGPASERPAGVYAAVESAVKRSRIEFLSRLLDYRRRLDCEAFATGGPDRKRGARKPATKATIPSPTMPITRKGKAPLRR